MKIKVAGKVGKRPMCINGLIVQTNDRGKSQAYDKMPYDLETSVEQMHRSQVAIETITQYILQNLNEQCDTFDPLEIRRIMDILRHHKELY
jgi:hypothetical protein